MCVARRISNTKVTAATRTEIENVPQTTRMFSLKTLETKREGAGGSKGMPQMDLMNIRNYDVRHLIPKVCSAVLKNGAEILIGSIVK